MKDSTKYKKVSFPAPKRIDLSKPVKSVTVLNSSSKSVFGNGQKEVQGKGAATKGIKFNSSPSGAR
jgi:phage gp45-like|tara:strand:- start:538 stop:735 length:198 start_codon:yes stop_codon:yes gene_type:complete